MTISRHVPAPAGTMPLSLSAQSVVRARQFEADRSPQAGGAERSAPDPGS